MEESECYVVLNDAKVNFPQVLGNPNVSSTEGYKIKYRTINSKQKLEKIEQDDIWIIKLSPCYEKNLIQIIPEIINRITRIYQLYQKYCELETKSHRHYNFIQKTNYLKIEIEKNSILKLIDSELKTLYSFQEIKPEQIPRMFKELNKTITESEKNIRELEIDLQIENMLIGAILGGIIGVVFTLLLGC